MSPATVQNPTSPPAVEAPPAPVPRAEGPQGRQPPWTFDADFYRSVLPQLVARDGDGRSPTVPVVELKLSDGTVLDLCQILRLEERWMAVAYYRDLESCDDADTAFLPYSAVSRIQISEHPVSKRRLGFDFGAGAGKGAADDH